MKKFNNYDYIFFAGFIFWLTSSAYFGWNEQASSVAKKYTDGISIILMAYGTLNSLVRGIKSEITFKVKGLTLETEPENHEKKD